MTPATPRYAEFRSLRYSAGGHPLTQLFSQRLGAVLAWLASRSGASPSAVTLLGLLVFLLAAALYATLKAGTGAALTCVVLLQLGYGLDCADGQLARATNRASRFGARLDVACDYGRTFALAAGAVYWLADRGLSLSWAAGSTALFVVGAAVHIHTATTLRGGSKREGVQLRGALQHVRYGITVLIDTAAVLFLIGVLREAPALLAPYLAGMGLLYLATSAYLARARLSEAH